MQIFLLGQGKCGVAVVRVSGPKCRQVLSEISGIKKEPPARMAILRKLRDPASGQMIDRGLVLYFPS